MDICGLIPAGGQATRLQPLPCSKELVPLGFRKLAEGQERPKVVSHYLLEKYRFAGADSTFFILRQGKWDIPAYYGNGQMVDMRLAYLMMDQPFGVPYTLDQAFPFIQNRLVLLGFPDIIFTPHDAFQQLLSKQQATGTDVVVGLFEVEGPAQAAKCDMVDWDAQGNIREIIIKPKKTNLTHSWIIAAWTPVFSHFMHHFLQKDLAERMENPAKKEIFLGNVLIAAIGEGLRVVGHLFPGHRYMDIGTPDELSKAYLRYSKLGE